MWSELYAWQKVLTVLLVIVGLLALAARIHVPGDSRALLAALLPGLFGEREQEGDEARHRRSGDRCRGPRHRRPHPDHG